MNLEKYKWKYRILLITTPNYVNKEYNNIKEKFEANLYKFHNKFVKKITKLDKNATVKVELIGFDGKTKYSNSKLILSDIFKKINSMPLGSLDRRVNPGNLSLYADYKPETTTKNLGFKDKEKALNSLELIKERPLTYQKNVVSTMLGRAKHHPHQTDGMRDAIKIYSKWLKKIK